MSRSLFGKGNRWGLVVEEVADRTAPELRFTAQNGDASELSRDEVKRLHQVLGDWLLEQQGRELALSGASPQPSSSVPVSAMRDCIVRFITAVAAGGDVDVTSMGRDLVRLLAQLGNVDVRCRTCGLPYPCPTDRACAMPPADGGGAT